MTYAYDGSFDGLMTCIFESYEKKEDPIDIQSANDPQYLLFTPKWIETEVNKANRVFSGIAKSISPEAQDLVRLGFLTCLEQKELLILRFLRLGFKHGASVMNMMADDTVHALQRGVRHLNNESHALTGFIRFSIYNNVLVAVIEPKNEVLPVLASHFCDRYSNESFMIYDKTHRRALVHQPQHSGGRQLDILEVEQFELPEADAEEIAYRRLWTQFYNTVAIKERMNLRARLSHMPKRYWSHLTELQD